MSDRFSHSMPFGAEPRSDGSVRFRLWAPGCDSVGLVLDQGETAQPLRALGDGWHELTTAAAAGSRYMFELPGGQRIPDPASRAQDDDVHGPSVVVDPGSYAWRTGGWRGRPWEETVLYELHIGTFTDAGTFDAIRRHFDHLVQLGVTAIELMPIADFPGRRGWGYDGVLQFAPEGSYGRPDDLKRLIDEAHARDLMVFLDVVYNHFGPDGNYLGLYAPPFFTERHHTAWGAAIDFLVPQVREFYVHNALYWLEEFRFDGLRFDAVHAILDDSERHILLELAETVRDRVDASRHVHLVLENGDNEARFLDPRAGARPRHYDAQWNDDFHHVCHALLTGESGGYYRDFADKPADQLARALAEGFVFQGQPFAFDEGKPRGEPSAHLPPAAFVNFVQNHDQVGNRAFGERLTLLAAPEALRAATAILLLAPQIPMLFMGEEWGEQRPFYYFTDFHGELAAAVRDGRRKEFAHFPAFSDPEQQALIPDPNEADTFAGSRLDWRGVTTGEGPAWLTHYRTLLDLRRRVVMPRLAGTTTLGVPERWGAGGLAVAWRLGDGSRLDLVANVSGEPTVAETMPAGDPLFATTPVKTDGRLAPWSVNWFHRP